MFKNHAIQMKVVNTKKNPEMEAVAPVEVKVVDPEQIAKIATDYTVKTIGAIGAVIAGHKVLSTVCEIAVVAVKAKLK